MVHACRIRSTLSAPILSLLTAISSATQKCNLRPAPISGRSGSTRDQEPFLRSEFSEELPFFLPYGRWIAYQSDESGRLEVYVA